MSEELVIIIVAGFAILSAVLFLVLVKRTHERHEIHINFKSEKEREFSERHLFKPL